MDTTLQARSASERECQLRPFRSPLVRGGAAGRQVRADMGHQADLDPFFLNASGRTTGTVTVLIGLLVVRTWSPVGSRFEDGRLLRALLLSALVVTGMGLWLCSSSLHPGTPLPGQ